MENLDRYLKIAKNVVIKPQENNIEEKIIKKLSNINDRDKSMLDANFLEYLKKSNSRLYLFSEKVRNNPGKFAVAWIIYSAIPWIFSIHFKKCQCW